MSLQASYIACVALFPNNKLKNLQKPTIATLLQNPRLPDTIKKVYTRTLLVETTKIYLLLFEKISSSCG